MVFVLIWISVALIGRGSSCGFGFGLLDLGGLSLVGLLGYVYLDVFEICGFWLVLAYV